MSKASPIMQIRQAFAPAGSTVLLLGRPVLLAEWTEQAAARDWRLIANTVGRRHIDYVWVGPEFAVPAVLDRLDEFLRLRRIDYVEITVGPTTPTRRLHDAFTARGYQVFCLIGSQLQHCPAPPAEWDAAAPAILLAAAPRHMKRLTQQTGMIDLTTALPRFGIAPRGVAHLGAHYGEELEVYRALGAARVLFVEADPLNFAELSRRMAGESGVVCVQAAVSDKAGEATFTRMNASQSGSLLTPKLHLSVHPDIKPTETFTVRTATLPAIMAEAGVDPADYDLLALDIQGAEGLALKGAAPLPAGFRAVATEVNYAEVYEGCAHIADIDDLLFPQGFARVEECSPFHHSWGDALYVRGAA